MLKPTLLTSATFPLESSSVAGDSSYFQDLDCRDPPVEPVDTVVHLDAARSEEQAGEGESS